MISKKSHLTCALGTLVMGAALVLISFVSAQATDAIDDPVRQPHLKSWSNVIPNADRRFVVLADFNNEAVLDRETGLVWEKSPGTGEHTRITEAAASACVNKTVGGRKGWRLPSIPELASLIDPTQVNPSLPVGHPFTGVDVTIRPYYWSATHNASVPDGAWLVWIHVGIVDSANVNNPFHVWCVRGGMNADRY